MRLSEEPRSSLTLWDYRRRVADLYALVRSQAPVDGWEVWRRERDRLFASHAQSPIPPGDRARFAGVPCFPYRADMRVTASIAAGTGDRVALPHSGEGSTPARAFGIARFTMADTEHELVLYRLDAYGDAVILPFGDTTNGDTTYGGGRYLIDTAKGADLGFDGDEAVLDFNFAYHPSCVHDPRWSCPLPPPANRLPIAIEAGERMAAS